MTPLERLKTKIETLVEEYNTEGDKTCHRVDVEWYFSDDCTWAVAESFDESEWVPSMRC